MRRTSPLKQFVGIFMLALLVAGIAMLSFIPLQSSKIIDHPLFERATPYQFVFFGFSTCSGVCPATLAKLANIESHTLNNTAQVMYIEILDHGNHAAASSYAKSFHTSFIGVAPEKAQLSQLRQLFNLNIRSIGEHTQHQGRLYLLKQHQGKQVLFKTYNALTFSTQALMQDIQLGV